MYPAPAEQRGRRAAPARVRRGQKKKRGVSVALFLLTLFLPLQAGYARCGSRISVLSARICGFSGHANPRLARGAFKMSRMAARHSVTCPRSGSELEMPVCSHEAENRTVEPVNRAEGIPAMTR